MYYCFVLSFCLHLHRLAVTISLLFYIFLRGEGPLEVTRLGGAIRRAIYSLIFVYMIGGVTRLTTCGIVFHDPALFVDQTVVLIPY